jgi:hypothetical protein
MRERVVRTLTKTIRRIVPDRALLPVYAAYATARARKILNAIEDPKRLELFGRQIYSQNEEDGIIAEIFQRVGMNGMDFIEFGCGTGQENNTRFLLEQGWSGLWIDGSVSNVNMAKQSFTHLISDGHLKILNEFVTRENINDLIACAGYRHCEIDFLSIDIDGNDAHVWRAIDVVSPRVVCIEYNARFGPRTPRTIDYNPHFVTDGGSAYGASLKLLEDIGREKKYALVGCNLVGVNAFFVRDDIVGDKFTRGSTEQFFHPPRYHFRHAVKKIFS